MPSLSGRLLTRYRFDGTTDDLLTAGYGISGLRAANPPAFVNPAQPTALELRRAAIFANYRSLVPLDSGHYAGGWFLPHQQDGKVAGVEYWGVLDDGTGQHQVTVVVQIPQNFCQRTTGLIVAPSSGSRGVFGAIGAVGAWALPRGWAVVYLDKGTGVGLDDISRDRVYTAMGQYVTREQAGSNSLFTAPLDAAQRQAFSQNYPHRLASKHAHNPINSTAYWGEYTLAAAKFALEILSQQTGKSCDAYNTCVIASGVSNGGQACLAAAEQDKEELLAGVVVAEPNIALPPCHYQVRAGKTLLFNGQNQGLLEYTLNAALYAPLRTALYPHDPLNMVPHTQVRARVAALAAHGLLPDDNDEHALAFAAQALQEGGWDRSADPLWSAMVSAQGYEAVLATFAGSYARQSVTQPMANLSYAALDAQGHVIPLPEAATFASVGNGIYPYGKIGLVWEGITGGQALRNVPGILGTPDLGLTPLLQLASEIKGQAVGKTPADASQSLWHTRVQTGALATQLRADLGAIPTVIVTGQADQVLAINHASRAYVHQCWQKNPRATLSYWEVPYAQHLDACLILPAYGARYVPLLGYLHDGLTAMVAHLRQRQRLPPSQVLPTCPRGESLPPLARQTHVPPPQQQPACPIMQDEQGLQWLVD